MTFEAARFEAESGGQPGPPAPGWFGKILGAGDFAHRRLPPPLVATLDGWLAGAMQHLQRSPDQSLPEPWLERYLGSPLWQFVLGSGVLDAQCWAGVLMPSVDAAGRYFPLVVLQPMRGLPSQPAAVASLVAWHAALAEAALATLQDALPAHAFDARLAQLPLVQEDGTLREDMAPFAGAWLAFTQAALHDRLRGRGAWWPYATLAPQDAAMPAGVGAIRWFDALPSPVQLAEMLAGDHG